MTAKHGNSIVYVNCPLGFLFREFEPGTKLASYRNLFSQTLALDRLSRTVGDRNEPAVAGKNYGSERMATQGNRPLMALMHFDDSWP